MRHQVSRTLAYTPAQLFALVGDVERYPDFVPWIASLRTWNRRRLGDGVDVLDAEAAVRFAIVRERFSTRVTRDANQGEISVSLLHGPFRKLQNRWRFLDDPAGCRVEFEIDFLFKSGLLDKLLAANFHHAVDKLMNTFEARAAKLYGPAAT